MEPEQCLIPPRIFEYPRNSDPHPELYSIFMHLNRKFFHNRLRKVDVVWSRRMIACPGYCFYYPGTRNCIIQLSEPLLRLRSRKDVLEILLHEMIHAFLYIVRKNTNRDDHSLRFQIFKENINFYLGLTIKDCHGFEEEKPDRHPRSQRKHSASYPIASFQRNSSTRARFKRSHSRASLVVQKLPSQKSQLRKNDLPKGPRRRVSRRRERAPSRSLSSTSNNEDNRPSLRDVRLPKFQKLKESDIPEGPRRKVSLRHKRAPKRSVSSTSKDEDNRPSLRDVRLPKFQKLKESDIPEGPRRKVSPRRKRAPKRSDSSTSKDEDNRPSLRDVRLPKFQKLKKSDIPEGPRRKDSRRRKRAPTRSVSSTPKDENDLQNESYVGRPDTGPRCRKTSKKIRKDAPSSTITSGALMVRESEQEQPSLRDVRLPKFQKLKKSDIPEGPRRKDSRRRKRAPKRSVSSTSKDEDNRDLQNESYVGRPDTGPRCRKTFKKIRKDAPSSTITSGALMVRESEQEQVSGTSNNVVGHESQPVQLHQWLLDGSEENDALSSLSTDEFLYMARTDAIRRRFKIPVLSQHHESLASQETTANPSGSRPFSQGGAKQPQISLFDIATRLIGEHADEGVEEIFGDTPDVPEAANAFFRAARNRPPVAKDLFVGPECQFGRKDRLLSEPGNSGLNVPSLPNECVPSTSSAFGNGTIEDRVRAWCEEPATESILDNVNCEDVSLVKCPVCSRQVPEVTINNHLDKCLADM